MDNPTGSRPTVAKINLGNFSENIETAKKLSNSEIIAVVKADAYGHGAKKLSKHAYDTNNIRNFAVATLEEALEVRQSVGKGAEILVLGYVDKDFFKTAIEQNLTLTLTDEKYIKEVNEAANEFQNKLKVALKIDTGMSRLGVSHAADVGEILSANENLDFKHIFSHLCAVCADDEFTQVQIDRFEKALSNNILSNKSCSLLASSAIQVYSNGWSFSRAGIMLYGYGLARSDIELKPVMSVYSRVTSVKKLKKGETVGYGRSFKADNDMLVGIVPIGYADGYKRSFAKDGFMFAESGERLKILGNVCMDMTMVDVTQIGEGAALGLKVEVLGENINADKLAEWDLTISYEILCGISKRVPRIYLER